MRILYVSPLNNACTYYRCTLPQRYINRSGWAEARLVQTVTKEYLDWADIVVFQRIVGQLMLHVVKYCKLVGKKVVYELDDNIFGYPDSPEYKKDNIQEETVSAIKILRQCDAVTVTTEALKNTINELVDTPVYILPNQLCFDDITGLNIVSKRDTLLIGWAGGHYHIQDLSLLIEPLSVILEKYPNAMIALFGGLYPKWLCDKFKERVLIQEFVSIENFYLQLSMFRFDIGLAPLYGNEFAKSRSNLRLLQYAAMGIPIVASDYGEYGKILSNGLAGIRVGNDGWAEGIEKLIESPEERNTFSRKARDYVRNNHDMAKNFKLWQDCYQEVMSGKTN